MSSLGKKAKVPDFHGLSNSDREALLEEEGLSAVLSRMAGVMMELRRSYRRQQRTEIAWAVALANKLTASKQLFRDFIAYEEVWAGVHARPKQSHQPNALKYVLRVACGTDERGTDRANFIHRALMALNVDERRPEKVAEAIGSRGGLVRLNKEHAASRNRKRRARKGGEKSTTPRRIGDQSPRKNTERHSDQVKVNALLTLDADTAAILSARSGTWVDIVAAITGYSGKTIELTVISFVTMGDVEPGELASGEAA